MLVKLNLVKLDLDYHAIFSRLRNRWSWDAGGGEADAVGMKVAGLGSPRRAQPTYPPCAQLPRRVS